MKKLVKAMLVLVVLLVVIVVGAVVGVGMYANQLAKKGIERGGTYALGVPTTVDSVSIGLLSGKFGMSGLNVANPGGGGYTSSHFLSLGSGNVAVNYSTLQQPVVDLPELTLRKIDVSLEKKGGKANYQTILDNLKKLQDSGSSKPSTGDEKKLVIQKLLIEDIKINVDMVDAGGLGQLAKLTIPLEKIELDNVGKTGTGVQGTGVTMEQLASIIVQAVLNAATEKAGGILPAELLNDLQSSLGQLNALKELPMKVMGDVKNVVDNLGKDLGKGLGDAADKIGKDAGDAIKDAGKDAADQIGKGIGDLLGGGKDKEKDKKK